VESNAAEKASRTRRSCTNYRQPAIPKARLRVERPIKPLSNTAGGTGSIIGTDPDEKCDVSEIELTPGLECAFDALAHGLQSELGIAFQ
jgi:hypothetical protein